MDEELKEQTPVNDPELIREMLHTSRNIAVVGISDKPFRASRNISRYLAENGYRVFGVNPRLSEVMGIAVYPDLEAAQAAAERETAHGIDLVDVFRAPDNVPAIVEEVIRLHIPYLWLQDEVVHDEAVAHARAAQVKCVQNDCIFREHARMAHEE
jgi:uncharacterized protein